MGSNEKQFGETCPGCGKVVDPLRAPAVSVVEGRIVHFCSLTCRSDHLNRGEGVVQEETPDVVEDEKPKIDKPIKGKGQSDVVGGAKQESMRGKKYRSPSIKLQLLQTALLLLVLGGVFFAQPFLSTMLLIGLVSAVIVVHTAFGLFKEGRTSAAQVAEMTAVPIAALVLLAAIGLGLSPRMASTSAVLLLFAKSVGKYLELLGRLRSGVLKAVEGPGSSSLSPSWRSNSSVAIRLRRVALVMDWARFPAALAVGLLVYLTQSASLGHAILSFATALVVLSPRVLRMVSGDAHLAAAYSAAKDGAVIRDASVIEQLANARIVLFMAKNTLLKEEMKVSDFQIPNESATRNVLIAVASLEAKAGGRIAAAITEYAKEQGAAVTPVEDFEVEPGLGVSGNTPTASVACGSRAFLLARGISTAFLEESARSIEASGRRALFVALDGEVEAVLGIEESPDPSSLSVNQQLRRLGLDPTMITSSEVDAAHALGLRMGIENVRFETSEEAITEVLEQIRAGGDGAILVGQGKVFEENLGLASTSIAIGSKGPTQAGVDAGNLGITSVLQLVELSKRSYLSTRINLAATIGSMMIGMALAISWFSPLVVVFVASLNAGVSALSTLNAPYPLVARMVTTVNKITKRIKRIISRNASIAV